MAVFVAVLVFIYGIFEKDFWWALWASFAAFFVSGLFEIIYATIAFNAVFGAISSFAELINQL